jgi:hypothetical protein
MLTALTLMLVPLLSTSADASAQDTGLVDDSTFIVEFTNEEITWENDWTIDEAGIVQESDFESFSLSSHAGLVYVTYLEAPGDSGGALGSFLEGFTSSLGTIENGDAGRAGTTYWSLDSVEGDDLTASLFSVLVEVDGYYRVVSAVAPAEALGEIVDLVKSTVEFDGDDAFADIESVTDS